MQRVFIGIPVDDESQQHINALLEPIIKSRQDIRWVPDIYRHLTLAFLGDMPIPAVEGLLQLFDETYQQESRFEYTLSTLTRFPEPTGKIIALVADPSGPLNRIFQLTLRLLDRNDLQLDLKEFRPHVTLGRINKARRVKTNFDQQTNINLQVSKITVYQSTPSASGSIYSVLKETELI